MSNPKTKILLVEDEPNLGEVMKDFLEMSGYQVQLCADGEGALEHFTSNPFDICVLDVMLPIKDGFELAHDIRRLDEDIPIVFLTARSQKEDRVKGFKTGCDDYITKPFSTEEFLLRIEAILKRCKIRDAATASASKSIYQLGAFAFDPSNLSLSSGDDKQQLTPREAALLSYFCKHKNQVVQREAILMEVWGDDSYYNSRSMDVFITRLRKRLKEDVSVSITSIHGLGYRFDVKE